MASRKIGTPDSAVSVTFRSGCMRLLRPKFLDPGAEGRGRAVSESSHITTLPGYVPQALLARRALFKTVGHFNIALRHADSTDGFCASLNTALSSTYYRTRWSIAASTRATSVDAWLLRYVELVKATLDRRRRHMAACLESPLSIKKDN